jgi:hypothetical protein
VSTKTHVRGLTMPPLFASILLSANSFCPSHSLLVCHLLLLLSYSLLLCHRIPLSR